MDRLKEENRRLNEERRQYFDQPVVPGEHVNDRPEYNELGYWEKLCFGCALVCLLTEVNGPGLAWDVF